MRVSYPTCLSTSRNQADLLSHATAADHDLRQCVADLGRANKFPISQRVSEGSGLKIDCDREPAEWDHALPIYKVAKSEGWTNETAQDEVRRFNFLVRRGERPKRPIIKGSIRLPVESPEQQQAYWRALGQFINDHAETEGLIFNMFRELGHINRRTGRAFFANSTAREILNRIDQLLCIRDAPPAVVSDLKHALAQLRKINNARNLILHNGWRYDDQANGSAAIFAGRWIPRN
jgi:hypothetical protein